MAGTSAPVVSLASIPAWMVQVSTAYSRSECGTHVRYLARSRSCRYLHGDVVPGGIACADRARQAVDVEAGDHHDGGRQELEQRTARGGAHVPARRALRQPWRREAG